MGYQVVEMARRSDHTREELNGLTLQAARRIVERDGIEMLSARKVAAEIGYTVGTIYQHFDGMDDLVHQMNAQTLEQLYARCEDAPKEGAPGERLSSLADAFISFAQHHRMEWEAVITYRYGPDHKWSPDYDAKVNALLGLMADATSSLYESGDEFSQQKDMRLLWVGLYGAFSLDVSDRLGKDMSLSEIIELLINTYLASKS